MRIAHVVADVGDEASGLSYSVVRLAEVQAEAGHEVSLHTLAARDVNSAVRVHVYRSARRPAALGISWSMNRGLARIAESTEILHSHGLWMMPNLYPAWAARRKFAKLIVSPRGMLDSAALRISPWRKQIMWSLAQRRALDRADMFHATSDMEADAIRAQGFDQPIAVVSNGVDIPELEPIARAQTVLYLGRIHRKKRLDRLVKAWLAIERQYPDWGLRIVGPEEDTSHVRDVRRLAHDSLNITFAPRVTGEAKLQEYQKAAVVVLPTDTENFGLVVGEALAAGTPVIVTKGAPWSGVEANGCGWWVEPTVQGVATALENAFTLGLEKLGEMGAEGRRWMEREFSWMQLSQRMVTSYAGLDT